jgi:hypothetical protein
VTHITVESIDSQVGRLIQKHRKASHDKHEIQCTAYNLLDEFNDKYSFANLTFNMLKAFEEKGINLKWLKSANVVGNFERYHKNESEYQLLLQIELSNEQEQTIMVYKYKYDYVDQTVGFHLHETRPSIIKDDFDPESKPLEKDTFSHAAGVIDEVHQRIFSENTDMVARFIVKMDASYMTIDRCKSMEKKAFREFLRIRDNGNGIFHRPAQLTSYHFGLFPENRGYGYKSHSPLAIIIENTNEAKVSVELFKMGKQSFPSGIHVMPAQSNVDYDFVMDQIKRDKFRLLFIRMNSTDELNSVIGVNRLDSAGQQVQVPEILDTKNIHTNPNIMDVDFQDRYLTLDGSTYFTFELKPKQTLTVMVFGYFNPVDIQEQERELRERMWKDRNNMMDRNLQMAADIYCDSPVVRLKTNNNYDDSEFFMAAD